MTPTSEVSTGVTWPRLLDALVTDRRRRPAGIRRLRGPERWVAVLVGGAQLVDAIRRCDAEACGAGESMAAPRRWRRAAPSEERLRVPALRVSDVSLEPCGLVSVPLADDAGGVVVEARGVYLVAPRAGLRVRLRLPATTERVGDGASRRVDLGTAETVEVQIVAAAVVPPGSQRSVAAAATSPVPLALPRPDARLVAALREAARRTKGRRHAVRRRAVFAEVSDLLSDPAGAMSCGGRIAYYCRGLGFVSGTKRAARAPAATSRRAVRPCTTPRPSVPGRWSDVKRPMLAALRLPSDVRRPVRRRELSEFARSEPGWWSAD